MSSRFPLLVFVCFALAGTLGSSAYGEGIFPAADFGGVFKTSETQTPVGQPPKAGAILSLVLTGKGSFSAALVWDGSRYPLSGSFHSSGEPQISTFPKLGTEGVTLVLTLNLNGPQREITGTLEEQTAGILSLTVPFVLSGAEPDFATGKAIAGQMQTGFFDAQNDSQDIFGDGFSIVRIGKTKRRSARFVTRLNDASDATSAGAPLRGRSYSVFNTLYQSNSTSPAGGQVFGNVDASSGGMLSTSLDWGKKPGVEADYYAAGIDTRLFFDSQKYPPTGPGGVVPIGTKPGAIRAVIRFKRGNLGESILEADIRIQPRALQILATRLRDNEDDTVGHPIDAAVGLRINPVTAQFFGTFKHPKSHQITSFHGAFKPRLGLLKDPSTIPGEGRGSFKGSLDPADPAQLGPIESGGVRILVTPG